MNTYKVITYANTFINYDMLGEGIYSTSLPILFSKETTIEYLVETFMKFENNSNYGKIFTENLLKCELKEITLSYK